MKKIITLILFFLVSVSANAQTDNNQESSLIIALDVRSDIRRWYLRYGEQYYSSQILDILNHQNITPTYASGVLYGKESGARTPEDFARMVVGPRSVSNDYTSILRQLFMNIPSGKYYSISSFARPYSLKALKGQRNTNRTFLIILTDGKYNGNDDYYGEAEYMKMDFSAIGREQFMKDILDVQTNYFCQFKEQISTRSGHIQLYEFIPLQQHFALESVLDFPHEIEAKRNKSGYVVTFDSEEISNDNYDIKKLEISLLSAGQIIQTEEIYPGEDIDFNISKYQYDSASIDLEIRAWVKFCEGIYDNTILHPYGSTLQGASGLTRHIKIHKEDNAKILGLIEFPDFLFLISFWTSSQEVAAATWGFIFILIVLIIVISIIYKSNVYKVKEGTIKI